MQNLAYPRINPHCQIPYVILYKSNTIGLHNWKSNLNWQLAFRAAELYRNCNGLVLFNKATVAFNCFARFRNSTPKWSKLERCLLNAVHRTKLCISGQNWVHSTLFKIETLFDINQNVLSRFLFFLTSWLLYVHLDDD